MRLGCIYAVLFQVRIQIINGKLWLSRLVLVMMLLANNI